MKELINDNQQVHHVLFHIRILEQKVIGIHESITEGFYRRKRQSGEGIRKVKEEWI